ncbi:unnamed protein product [Adineta ricciae]|uniref:Uncharacterized protein n=1 Tax=Adineta ricciae TaxID=249248 RepID=A0A815AVD7_ADIRI|nr:unnamed protein product [Adineta ricciae]CAF1547095.1 unnamed protein product [Adineta ricciae]
MVLLGCLVEAMHANYHGSYSSIQNRSSSIRVAHCMTGTPRTLYKEEVYTAYRHQVLDVLPGDLFVVLEHINKTEMIHGTRVRADNAIRYKSALKYLSPRIVEWISIGDSLGSIETRSGYAKWKRCFDHIQRTERINGMKYDFIVRTRPDLYFAKALPKPSKLPKDKILINPYYECVNDIPSGYDRKWAKNLDLCDLTNYGVSDLFAIVPRALAYPYMCVAYITDLPLAICGERAHQAECAIKATLHKANVTYEFWPFVVKIKHVS